MGNMKKYLRGFKKLDIFSQPVNLMIKKEDGHRTVFGATVTIAVVGIVLALFIQNILSLVNHWSPTQLQSLAYHQDPQFYSLFPKNFTIQFGIEDQSYSTYIDESIFIVNASAVYAQTTVINSSYSESKTITQDIPLVPCSATAIKQQNLLGFYDKYNMATNYCFDWDGISQINLQGAFNSLDYQYIYIEFWMCTNTTKRTNGPPCQDIETIKNKFLHNHISIQLSSVNLDINNYDNPFQDIGVDLFSTISSELYKEFTVYYSGLTLYTDDGLVIQNNISNRTLKFDSFNEIIDTIQDSKIAVLNIRMSTEEIVNQRSYPKIQTILSQVGGLWNVFFTVGMILSFPINTLSYKLLIVNSLFNFQGQKAKSKNVYNRDSSIPPQNLQTLPSQNNNSPVSNPKITNRLNSIIAKHDQIGALKDTDLKGHLKLQKAISQSIKGFFNVVSQKIKLNCFEYMTYFRCTLNRDKKKLEQIQFAVQKMEKSLDILYIIKKLQELDKLKMLLLTESQLKVFDYLSKPTIAEDPKSMLPSKQYYSILKSAKSDLQKAKEAQMAYQEIIRQKDNQINRQLIYFMDENIIELLKMNFQDRRDFTMTDEEINIEQSIADELNGQIIEFNI